MADVYDALTAKRVYKDAMPHEQASAIINKDAGSHFDPDVVAVFNEVADEFATIKQQSIASTHRPLEGLLN